MKQREMFYLMDEKKTIERFVTREEAVDFFKRLPAGQYKIALVFEEVDWEYCDWDPVTVLGYFDPIQEKWDLLKFPIYRNPADYR